MTTFRDKILGNATLISGLAARGFTLSAFDSGYENGCAFMQMGPATIHVELYMSPVGNDAFQCDLLVSSMFVTEIFHERDLYFDRSVLPPRNDPEGVLAVNLLWLRRNADPESEQDYRHDYKLTSDGARRVLEDLDTVGQTFVSEVATPRQLADFLMRLEDYPARIKWGHKPGSANPFIFAAILYLEAGDKLKARASLARGLAEYDFPEPRLYWQNCRLEDFRKRRELLLAEIDEVAP